MAPDPKGGRRIVDPAAVRAALLRFNWCAACGGEPGGAHHVVQRGAPHFGDDVEGNIVGLCGTGTVGCHGAYHGNTYVYKTERRDAEWVAQHIGQHLLLDRVDVIAYVTGKLGEDAGWAYLERFYGLNVRPVSESPR